ncbi:ATP-binding cassette domain-containing protein [Fuchsiella alkaliacetigena]|uniref:ATP-binding cassette domain-containing protein n=1 Tax=Fuchsiella alkaliacetigena TaxID=957042 RepID=UPI00200AB438|nr:ATP-binding cassette domain-containing protein [Fuchsiella alkaliacetigena]MCK8823639.1 ATP-binding cassette domain-containing protein [Fuchsiella alkaliacetigena]
MENIIEVNNLAYKYGDGTKALADVSFAVEKNTRVAILGPNGAGKSTLLFHLNALYLAQQGQVKIKSQVVNDENKEWVRSQVGLVMQDPDDQVFSTTVYEDVAFGLLNFGWSDEEKIKERIEWALSSVDILDLQDASPHNLSYGQKKRVAIAGILAIEPEIIIFDEPLSYLDPQGKADFLGILDRLHKTEKTLLVVTHDMDFAAEWADRVIVIEEGRVLAEGGRELLANLELIEQANLDLPTITKLFQRLELTELSSLPQTIEEAVTVLKERL